MRQWLWIALVCVGCGGYSVALNEAAAKTGAACEVPSATKSGAATLENVVGTPLATCSTDPLTGWFRDGQCRTNDQDQGRHLVCAQMTNAFLDFTRSQGNDLSTPRPRIRFPGLRAGDRWCLCAVRWREALRAGSAPPVVLESTHEAALRYVTREALESHRVGASVTVDANLIRFPREKRVSMRRAFPAWPPATPLAGWRL